MKFKGMSITTIEGPSAWQEAIREISRANPQKPYRWSDGLALGAREHCKDSVVGHTGSDGSSPFQRMERYGSPKGW